MAFSGVVLLAVGDVVVTSPAGVLGTRIFFYVTVLSDIAVVLRCLRFTRCHSVRRAALSLWLPEAASGKPELLVPASVPRLLAWRGEVASFVVFDVRGHHVKVDAAARSC